jgi:peptide/nickel transport system permease protein
VISAKFRQKPAQAGMLSFILRRILATLPVMAVVALFVFSLLYLSPGDPAAVIGGDRASAEEIARIREQLGLNQPFLTQFFHWFWNILRGDFGVSIFTQTPVAHLIVERMEPTIALTITTMAIAIPLGVPLGILAAWKFGTWIDKAVMLFSVLGFSIPVFVIGYCLVYAFSISIDLFPVQGYTSIRAGLWPFLQHLILPSVALGAVYVALIMRMTRTAMLEVLAQDYIMTARAKGLNEGSVLAGHALKNASIPIVTTIGLGIALVITGVVVTESVFAIPGLGRLTIDAILRRDYPVIQGIILVFSFCYMAINLLVDISYTFLDPRIRY